MSAHHGNRIHDPGHGLFVCINVRRGNVSIRTDDRSYLKCVTPREPFQLVARQTLGIANDAAFATPVRNANRGTLPGHPRSKRLNLIQSDIWVIANAALAWAARDVVLHAVALEDL